MRCRQLSCFCSLKLATKSHKQLQLLFLQEEYLITASLVFPQMPEVCSTIIHANFTTTREGFDVALLKLATPSDKTPVNLLYSKLPDGQEVKSLGWPSTLTTISKNLQDFALSVLDREQCGDRIRKDCKCEFQVMDSIVCAQATDKDACTGELKVGYNWNGLKEHVMGCLFPETQLNFSKQAQSI